WLVCGRWPPRPERRRSYRYRTPVPSGAGVRRVEARPTAIGGTDSVYRVARNMAETPRRRYSRMRNTRGRGLKRRVTTLWRNRKANRATGAAPCGETVGAQPVNGVLEALTAIGTTGHTPIRKEGRIGWRSIAAPPPGCSRVRRSYCS